MLTKITLCHYSRSPRRRKLLVAFGAALAASGLAFAYKAYQDDSLNLDYKAQCAEDDCNKKKCRYIQIIQTHV